MNTKGLLIMKKVLSVLIACILVVCSLGLTASASGEISQAFADFDPQSIMDMFAGVDLGGLTDSLGNMDVSAITNLFKGMDLETITNLFDGLDLGKISDILGGIDIGGLIGGLKPTKPSTTKEDVSGDTTKAPDTTKAADNNNDTTKVSDTTKAPVNNNNNSIPKTGDKGIVVALSVCGMAAAAFLVVSKKKEA